MHSSPALAAVWHCHKKILAFTMWFCHKSTCTFKLSWTNCSKHLNHTFPILRTARVTGVQICHCSSWGLQSSHQHSITKRKVRKKPHKPNQTFTDFQHIKLLQEVPKEIISSQTVGLMAPLITGQGCSCWAEEGQGLLSRRRISHCCPWRPPLECRQSRGRKHKKAACA